MANEKLKVQRYKGGKPKEGDTLGWKAPRFAESLAPGGKWRGQELGGTGWKRENNKWVQYKRGKRTGNEQVHRIDTNAFSGSIANIGRAARFAGLMPFRLAGLSSNVVQGTLENRKNMKLQKKYEDAYATLEAKKDAPRKGRLYIDPAGELIDLDKISPTKGGVASGEYYINNKGDLKIRSQKEIDKLKADIKAKEEKAKFDKQSFGAKLSQSFSAPLGEQE